MLQKAMSIPKMTPHKACMWHECGACCMVKKRMVIWYNFDVPQVHLKFLNQTEIWFIRWCSHNLATAGNEWKWISKWKLTNGRPFDQTHTHIDILLSVEWVFVSACVYFCYEIIIFIIHVRATKGHLSITFELIV